jgi:HSP20 family protein
MANNVTLWDPVAVSPSALFEALPTLFRPFTRAAADAGLRMDVSESDAAYRLAVEMPGVPKEDIRVSVHENSVSISAETREERSGQDGQERQDGEAGRPNWLLRERSTGRVNRTITLPEKVDDASAEAKYENGVLFLTLPKSRVTAARRVAVH